MLKLRAYVAFAAIFAVLLASRYRVLTDPPMPEQARGLWFEAIFLAETGFDYPRLWFDEPGPDQSGASNYLTSVLPTLIAALMSASPEPRFAIVAYHLFTFACAALLGTQVILLLWDACGPTGAVLTCVAVLTAPALSAQIDLLGMDVPMTAFALLSARHVMQRRFGRAAISSTVAFAMKATGCLVTVATLICLPIMRRQETFLGRGESDDRETDRRISDYRRGWRLNAAALCLQLTVNLIGGAFVVFGAFFYNTRNEVHSFFEIEAARFICPDLVLLLSICTLGSFMHLALFLRHLGRKPVRGLVTQPLFYFSWTMLLGILAPVVVGAFLIRYVTVGIPFLYMILAMLLFGSGRCLSLAANLLLTTVIALNLANRTGDLYPSLDEVVGPPRSRVQALLERSHEYRLHLKSLQTELATLDDLLDGQLIVSEYPHALLLALPRLGFVERAKHGYALHINSRFVTNFLPLSFDDPASLPTVVDPVFVWVPQRNGLTIAPVEPGDEILAGGAWPETLVAFRKRWQDEPPIDPPALAAWLDQQGWAGGSLAERLRLRAYLQILTGHKQDLALEYRRLLFQDAIDASSRQALLLFLARNGCANPEMILTNAHDPSDQLAGEMLLGELRTTQGMFEQAVEWYRQATRTAPEHWPAYRALAAALQTLDRNEEAAEVIAEVGRRMRSDANAKANSDQPYTP